MKFIIKTLIITFSTLCSGKNMNTELFKVNTDLLDNGLKFFDPQVTINNKLQLLESQLNHPEMKIVFERYSHPARPLDSRVSGLMYKDFLTSLWNNKESQITHPRMKSMIHDYQWGFSNYSLLKNDVEHVKINAPKWLAKAIQLMPWDSEAIEISKNTNYKLFFLVDPGGSYPWAHESKSSKALYFDVLKLRNINPKARTTPIDDDLMIGFVAHEMFHMLQKSDQGKTKTDWLLWAVVAEGSASLIGNNMPNSKGEKYRPNEKSFSDKDMLIEWLEYSKQNTKNIEKFWKLYKKWHHKQPSESEFFQTLTSEKWIASPSNKMFMGNLYRIGAEMLLEIKNKLGDQIFYKTIANPSQLPEVWKKITP